MRRAIVTSFLVVGMLTLGLAAQEDRAFSVREHGVDPIDPGNSWVSLLPPVGLEGWNIVGGSAMIERTGGELHGFRAGGRNTFLISTRTYGNFILEGEIKIEPGGNSGWQVRSHQPKPGDRRSPVHGYQLEVDTSERGWSGGLYDEGRRAWMHPLDDDENARAAFKKDEWNHYRIELDGGHVRAWVNGVPCADALDFADLSGSIAFQVHSGQCDVRWRNLRIAELGRSMFTDVGRWQPAGPNPAASHRAFAPQPDSSVKGRSGSVPVAVLAPIPGPGGTVRLGYRLRGKALVRIRSGRGDDGFEIHLDELDSEKDGSITGLDATESEFPVVTSGAGLDSVSGRHDLLIDIEGRRVTVLRDGQVLSRVHAKEPVHADMIEVELPPGENEIELTPPSVLSRALPTLRN
jgi:hypothetical protein